MNFKFEIGQKKESGLIFILAERLFIDNNTVLSQSHLSLIDYCQASLSPKPKGPSDSLAEN